MGWPQALVPERALVLVRALVPERVLVLALVLARALVPERVLEPALVLERVQVALALAPEWAPVSGQGQGLALALELALARGSAQEPERAWALALAHRLPHRHKPPSPQRRTTPPRHASAGGWRARKPVGWMVGLPGSRPMVQQALYSSITPSKIKKSGVQPETPIISAGSAHIPWELL